MEKSQYITQLLNLDAAEDNDRYVRAYSVEQHMLHQVNQPRMNASQLAVNILMFSKFIGVPLEEMRLGRQTRIILESFGADQYSTPASINVSAEVMENIQSHPLALVVKNINGGVLVKFGDIGVSVAEHEPSCSSVELPVVPTLSVYLNSLSEPLLDVVFGKMIVHSGWVQDAIDRAAARATQPKGE